MLLFRDILSPERFLLLLLLLLLRGGEPLLLFLGLSVHLEKRGLGFTCFLNRFNRGPPMERCVKKKINP